MNIVSMHHTYIRLSYIDNFQDQLQRQGVKARYNEDMHLSQSLLLMKMS
jgi:hypothetical protein